MNLDRMRLRAQDRRCADHFAESMEAHRFAFVGTVPRVMGNVAGTAVHDYLDDMFAVLFSRGGPSNVTLNYSVGSNALTIAVKEWGGSSDADADLPAVVGMRSATAASGDSNVRKWTASASLVVSSGSTLGHAASDSRWTYLYAIEDGSGGLELAISSKFHGVQGIVTTVAEGGAGAADSATSMYSTTARTSTPFHVLGRAKLPQTVAGTWAAGPTSAEAWPFAAPAGMTLIQSQSASTSASLDFTGGINSDFDEYELHYNNLVPATDDATLQLRFSEDGGSTWKAGASDYAYDLGMTTNNANNDSSSAAATNIRVNGSVSNVASEGGCSGVLSIRTPSNASAWKAVVGRGGAMKGSNHESTHLFGLYIGTTNAVNGFRLLFSSGNIASGTVALYGVNK